VAGLVLWCPVASALREVLGAYPFSGLMVLGAIAFVSLFAPVIGGTLQGARYFGWMASASIGGAGARLVLAVLAVALGGGVTAVLVAVALALGLGLLIGYLPFHRVFVRTPLARDLDTRPVYRYFWPVLAGHAMLFLLMNADLILSVRFLEGEELAAYGKAAMLSRTVLWLPLPVVVAMFPRAVNTDRIAVLLGAFGFALFTCVAGALFISLLPGLPLRVMYGIDTPLHRELARVYVWAIVPVCLATILAQYLWARHRTSIVVWSAPAVAAFLAALFLFHETAFQVLGCLAAGGSAVLLWFGLATVRLYRTRVKSS
jgi:O-antigen/teichoic acid export membrane protein